MMGGPRRGVPASEFLAAMVESGGDIRKVDAAKLLGERSPVGGTRASPDGIIVAELDGHVLRAEVTTDRMGVMVLIARGSSCMVATLTPDESERLESQLATARSKCRRRST